MPRLEAKTFDHPEETRPFQANGRLDLIKVGDMTVGRGTYEPGWRWSENVKPIAQTDSCQATHAGYVVSGRMHIRMNDGNETEIGPGQVVLVEPGHDAWVIGGEACVLIDFGTSVSTFAAPH